MIDSKKSKGRQDRSPHNRKRANNRSNLLQPKDENTTDAAQPNGRPDGHNAKRRKQKMQQADAVKSDSPAAAVRKKGKAKGSKRLKLPDGQPVAGKVDGAGEHAGRSAPTGKKTLRRAGSSSVEGKPASARKRKRYPPSAIELLGPQKRAQTPRTPTFALPKPEQTVQLANQAYVRIWGLSAQTGKRYTLLVCGEKRALIAYELWHGGGGEASLACRAQGLTIVLDWAKIREAVGVLKRFTPVPIAVAPGWSGSVFALADGSLFAPSRGGQPHLGFTPNAEIIGRNGTLAGWRRGVAKPLAGHLLATFFMMTMFAGPLLRFTRRLDNLGFEIAGPPGRGKSTLQLLMASAVGPAVGSTGATYWRSLNTTINALEEAMPSYNDLTMVLDEAGGLPGSGKEEERADQMRGLAFRLAGGHIKGRYGERSRPRNRLIYVISTNRSVISLVSQGHSAEAEAVADRLMTVPLIDDRQFGIFDSQPAAFGSTGAFAEMLKVGASQDYGHAMPAYLRYLVTLCARAPKLFQRWVNWRVARFVRACGADTNNGSQLRVAEAFGLVEAGGYLAGRAGVLPKNYRTSEAALECYRLHRDHGRVPKSFDDRLRSLIRNASTIDLDKLASSRLPAEQVAARRAFLLTSSSGVRELMVPRAWRDRLFPDWNRLRDDPDFRRRLKTSERDRNTNDRVIRGQKWTGYVFNISDLEE